MRINRFINSTPAILKRATPPQDFNLMVRGTTSSLITDEATADAIYQEDSVGALRRTLNNKIARKLVQKLSDEVEVKYALFAPKDDELVKGVTKSQKALYLPFVLVFGDGQVLSAYGRNTSNRKNKKVINYSRETLITSWYLNNVDITNLIGYSAEQSDSELVSNLAKVINRTHTKFISKNLNAKEFQEKIENIKNLIAKKIEEYNSQKSNKAIEIAALQAEYNNRENLIEANSTNNGSNQAQEIRAKNREIEKKLKELGGDIPKQIVPDLPKSDTPPKQIFFINLTQDDVMKYGKKILEALGADDRLKNISYKIQFDDERGFKQTVGGLGGVKLDGIDGNSINVSTAVKSTKEDEIIKGVIVEIIVEVSKEDEITPENIAELYPNMSDEEINENKELISSILYNRFDKIFKELVGEGRGDVSHHFKQKYLDGSTMVSHSNFGVKDTMEPIDEYIEEIMESEEYRDFIAQQKEIKPPKPTDNVIGGTVGSLATIYQIDIGKELGYDRKLFVSSIVNKIKTQNKNMNFRAVVDTVDFIEGMNEWALNNRSKKKLISDRSPIWKLRENAKYQLEIIKSTKNDRDLGILTLELQQKVTNQMNPDKTYSADEVRSLIQKEISDKIENDKILFPLIAKNQDVLEDKIFKSVYDPYADVLKKSKEIYNEAKTIGEVKNSDIGDKSWFLLSENGTHFSFNSTRFEYNVVDWINHTETFYNGKDGDKALEIYKEKSMITDDTTYDFNKFNSITSSKEFGEQLEELEEQLDSDGVIDDHEEKLNNLLDKLAELMKKERE